MSELSTTELEGWLAKLSAGDSKARNDLIVRMMERLRTVVRRTLAGFDRVRRFEDTDDVLQGVLMRLMHRLETVYPPTVADFLRLAAFEARRALIDLSRHYCGTEGAGTREKLHAPIADGPAEFPETNQSTYVADRLANWTEFHQQIELLPQEEGDVFAMLWYNDLKHEEVAAALGVSVATVKRRWIAARLRLQGWFEG